MRTVFLLLFFAVLTACSTDSKEQSSTLGKQKIGVLLVNHGSHSPTWRQALLDLDSSVREAILANEHISAVKTAFMEYTEPSIASRMKEFDAEGYTDVIIVPVFLTVSSHSFDDIPTIIGLKSDPASMEHLKIEKIETYEARANCHITPLLDFTQILQQNVMRRIKSLSSDPSKEGVAFIAYGDKGYDAEWSALMDSMGSYINDHLGIQAYSYGWCGHIANYDPEHTTRAINNVLDLRETALVLPVLVAHDEMFQIQIIGDGIKAVENYTNKVVYKPDAILPDSNIEKWVIDIVAEYSQKISQGNVAQIR